MSTYPDLKLDPADLTAAQAIDGSVDDATQLEHIAKGTSSASSTPLELAFRRWERRLVAILGTACQLQVVAEATAGKIGVFPGRYRLGGSDKTFAGATGQSVSNGTWCVYLDSSNALQIVAEGTGFPVDQTTFMPLAKVTAAAGVVTAVEDWRNACAFKVQ